MASQFERSIITFHEAKLDGVDLSSNRFDYGVRKSRGKIIWQNAIDLILSARMTNKCLSLNERMTFILPDFR